MMINKIILNSPLLKFSVSLSKRKKERPTQKLKAIEKR
jgi:hypothetical protein